MFKLSIFNYQLSIDYRFLLRPFRKDDATLVCDKEHAGEIKKILAKLREEGKNEYL